MGTSAAPALIAVSTSSAIFCAALSRAPRTPDIYKRGLETGKPKCSAEKTADTKLKPKERTASATPSKLDLPVCGS